MLLSSDTSVGISKSMGFSLKYLLQESFDELKPDIVSCFRIDMRYLVQQVLL